MSWTRRSFLRGAVRGVPVALALPALEATLPDARADDGGLGPIFGVFFWANGLPWHAGHGAVQAGEGNLDLWTPTETGQGFTPPQLLAPIAHRDISVLTGLTPQTDVPDSPAGQSDGHMRGFMVALTGDRPRSDGFDHPSHTLTALRPSLDQLVAKDPAFYAERSSRYRSLELGVSTSRFHDYGHWNNISYNGPDSLNPAVTDPRRLYDLIFGVPTGDVELARRSSLLDAVLDDAARLRAKLGAADAARLEAHMEHLYEVQRRLDLGAIACEAPEIPGSSGDLLTQTAIMADLLALGLACNITRVFSMMLCSPASTHIFSELGVTTDMHTVCHDGDWSDVRNITERQMLCFGVLLDAMANTVDPTGASLLDRAGVFGVSEYGEGYQHSVAEMPVVIAGRANGALKPGHHIRDAGGNISRAQLTVLRAVGMDLDTFGFNGGETGRPFSALLA